MYRELMTLGVGLLVFISIGLVFGGIIAIAKAFPWLQTVGFIVITIVLVLVIAYVIGTLILYT